MDEYIKDNKVCLYRLTKPMSTDTICVVLQAAHPEWSLGVSYTGQQEIVGSVDALLRVIEPLVIRAESDTTPSENFIWIPETAVDKVVPALAGMISRTL